MPYRDAMREDHWQRLQNSVTRLFRPGLRLETFMSRTAKAVRGTIDCDLCTVGVLDLRSRNLKVYYDEQHADFSQAMEGYAAHMHKYPLFRFDPWVAEGKPFLRSDFYSERQFRDLDIYSDCFRVAGVSEHAAIPIFTDKNTIVFAGLERSGRSFSDEDRERLTLLQPHLTNARRTALACSKIKPENIQEEHFAMTELSAREAEVLTWMIRGKTHAEIGALLRLRTQTIKGYAQNVYQKLGVDNRHAAILRALEIASFESVPKLLLQVKRAKIKARLKLRQNSQSGLRQNRL